MQALTTALHLRDSWDIYLGTNTYVEEDGH